MIVGDGQTHAEITRDPRDGMVALTLESDGRDGETLRKTLYMADFDAENLGKHLLAAARGEVPYDD